MIWTAWNNSEHHKSGSGYGLKVTTEDRDHHFKAYWKTVFIELPSMGGFITAEANISKKSFWSPRCREMIKIEIGQWLRAQGYAPWPDGAPPKFEVEMVAHRRFRVKNIVTI